MSYTPKTWATGDTIDATSMNHIEQGIVSAESSGGGGSVAKVTVSATGYNSASKRFGTVAYCYNNNGAWTVLSDALDIEDDYSYIIYGNVQPQHTCLPPLIISDDIKPFLFLADTDGIIVTGDISDTTENIYYSYGSFFATAYRISGSGSVQFFAD